MSVPLQSVLAGRYDLPQRTEIELQAAIQSLTLEPNQRRATATASRRMIWSAVAHEPTVEIELEGQDAVTAQDQLTTVER
jgi:hypothetical protein